MCIKKTTPYRVAYLIIVSVFVFSGCTNLEKSKVPVGSHNNTKSEETSLSGVWDWRLELVTDDGDFRVERESWVLRENKGKVSGSYQRRVTVISRDGKPFECSGETSYNLDAEFKVEGSVGKKTIKFKEKAVKVNPGPCEKGQRRLDEYTGRLVNGELVLKWDGGEQTLRKRVLTGVWVWDDSRTLPDGDRAYSREVWHIVQDKKKLRGIRLRRDMRSSRDDKPYRCNGRLNMGRYVKWDFAGDLDVDTAKVAYDVPIVKKGPCENRSFKRGEGILKLGYEDYILDFEMNSFNYKLVRQGGCDLMQTDDIHVDRTRK